jgi:hypothetical protein
MKSGVVATCDDDEAPLNSHAAPPVTLAATRKEAATVTTLALPPPARVRLPNPAGSVAVKHVSLMIRVEARMTTAPTVSSVLSPTLSVDAAAAAAAVANL